jgi:hypothetical protein
VEISMRLKLTFAAVAASLIILPAQAAPASEGAKVAKAKKTCRKQQPPTGSRLGATKVCATAEEWAARDEAVAEARKNIERVQSQRGLAGE